MASVAVAVALIQAALYAGLGRDLVGDAAVYTTNKIAAYISTLPRPFDLESLLGDRALPFKVSSLDDVLNTRIHLALEAQRLRTDFALQANGGKIICQITTGCYIRSFHIPGWLSSPEHAITESEECWSPRTSTAQLGIQLATSMHPTHVTVELSHLGEASPSILLWGLLDGSDNERRYRETITESPHLPVLRERPGLPAAWSGLRGLSFISLAYYRFNASTSAKLQTIPVFDNIQSSQIPFSIVALEILDLQEGDRLGVKHVRIHGEVAIGSSSSNVSGSLF